MEKIDTNFKLGKRKIYTGDVYQWGTNEEFNIGKGERAIVGIRNEPYLNTDGDYTDISVNYYSIAGGEGFNGSISIIRSLSGGKFLYNLYDLKLLVTQLEYYIK